MSAPDVPAGRLATLFFLKSTIAKLLLVMFLVGGWLAYSGMIKETNPDLQIAAASITTTWPGGDAQTIEQEVTNKLEKELRTLKGLKRILSGSFAGYSVISVEFRSGVDPQDALARLQTKVSQAEGELPKAADKPSIRQASVNDSPVFGVRLFGDRPLTELSALAKTIETQLEEIPGANQASVAGNREDIVMIRLIGARMWGLNISPTEVQNAIQSANLDMPWGQFDGEEMGATFRLAGRYRSVDALENLPIKRLPGGRIVSLGEIAEVTRTEAEERTRTFYSHNGQPYQETVAVSLTKRSGADTLDVVQRAKDVVAAAQERSDWPEGVEAIVVVDESIEIDNSLSNIFKNGWQAMLAVFAILMISLTWREAIIAGLAIPVAFAGGLIMIAALGYSLNTIVIVGMVIALGLLVDVFILMMEGMHENIFGKGKSFGAAALATVKAYAMPALSGQLTTILAMAPLLGIAGITGEFIRPMPMAAIACLVASYIVAIFLTIPLSRYILPKPGKEVKKTLVDRLSERASSGLAALLESAFIRTRWLAAIWVAVAIGVFGFAFLLFSTLPSELMPKGDGRNMGILVELEPNSSMASSQSCADAVGEVLRELPYVEKVTMYVGEKSPFSQTSLADQLSPSESLGFVGFSTVFTPKDKRAKLGYEYVPEMTAAIQPAMAQCPGGKLLMNPSLGGASAEAPIQIELTGNDMDVLRAMADEVMFDLSETPGTSNIRHNLGLSSLDIKATPRNEALSFYGISHTELASQIRAMTSTDEVGKFVVGGVDEDIKIMMGYGWPSRDGEIGGPTSIAETYFFNVVTPAGKSVPLNSLVSMEFSETSLTILHKDGKRTLTVLADTTDRTASEVLADIQSKLNAQQENWPEGYSFNFAGEAESSNEVFGSAQTMLVLALFLVFALLVLQFDSFLQPLVIMAAIPLALTGTFFGFYLFQMPFSFMAMIGVIALIGIVVNDTIVMIDTMNGYRAQGMPTLRAAAHGASDRLRPILTTSITTIVGMIPLALSEAMWLPLGLTVISGLVFATVLALFVVPCLYVLFTSQATVDTAA